MWYDLGVRRAGVGRLSHWYEPCRQQLACRMVAIGATSGATPGAVPGAVPGVTMRATAKARVEVDGLSAFAGSSPAPGRELRSSCWHPLSAPAPQAASPFAGFSFTANYCRCPYGSRWRFFSGGLGGESSLPRKLDSGLRRNDGMS